MRLQIWNNNIAILTCLNLLIDQVKIQQQKMAMRLQMFELQGLCECICKYEIAILQFTMFKYILIRPG